MLHVALAGNPNSGKTTLFNELTGLNQHVGNWPGVTVEKKTGEYIKDKEIKFTDLPGIYSLSPYTIEEVVARDFLLEEKVDIIINVVDSTNIERSLYLTSQLFELGIPVIIALNMTDVLEKRGDKIDIQSLENDLKTKCIQISASEGKNIDELVETAKSESKKVGKRYSLIFSNEFESFVYKIEEVISYKNLESRKNFYAKKLFERDKDILKKLSLKDDEEQKIEEIVKSSEEFFDDDSESIITNERYNLVEKVTKKALTKAKISISTSEKIDKVLTNKNFAIPIFLLIIFLVYYLAMDLVGGAVTDFTNEVVIAGTIDYIRGVLESLDVMPWLVSLVTDGVLSGVGAVLGFLPVIATLFFFIGILEDCGYMSRVAFIYDRLFRKFGMSGKSLIPILMGSGCSVPAIMGTRTIENEKDRRITIICSSFLPCSAKADVLAAFSVIIGGSALFAPLWYVIGILAVIISGLILKKSKSFDDGESPFIMELPDYHIPKIQNVLKKTLERCKSFINKALTIIVIFMILIWFLQNISTDLEFGKISAGSESLLEAGGKKMAFIFEPLGFGNWVATVSTFLGVIAKEIVVGTLGVIQETHNLTQGVGITGVVNEYFPTNLSIISFLIFNQLTLPCLAAISAIKSEIGGKKWFTFAIGYLLIFSWTSTLIVYQLGKFITTGISTAWTAIAILTLGIYIFLIIRPSNTNNITVDKIIRQKIK